MYTEWINTKTEHGKHKVMSIVLRLWNVTSHHFVNQNINKIWWNIWIGLTNTKHILTENICILIFLCPFLSFVYLFCFRVFFGIFLVLFFLLYDICPVCLCVGLWVCCVHVCVCARVYACVKVYVSLRVHALTLWIWHTLRLEEEEEDKNKSKGEEKKERFCSSLYPQPYSPLTLSPAHLQPTEWQILQGTMLLKEDKSSKEGLRCMECVGPPPSSLSFVLQPPSESLP